MVKISFPGNVWDGTNNVTQRNASVRRAPDRHDYDQIAGELIATQTRVLELSEIIVVATDHDDSLENSLNILYVLVDTSGGDVNITLPDPTLQRFAIHIKKIDPSGYAVNILPHGSETIDGDTELIVTGQWNAAMLITDREDWYIV